MNEPTAVPGFAPSDPTDGRKPLDWKSRYSEQEARKGIKGEALYLAVLLVSIPILMLILWLDGPKTWFGIPETKYGAIVKYGIAWLAGTLGGTLFSLKWLYHAVAHGIWNIDRRLWRVLTPHLSGGLSFAVLTLLSSGLIRVFDSTSVESLPLVTGIGFLTGYFSDSAIAKLTEIAETLFGSNRTRPKKLDPGKSEEVTNAKLP